MKKNYLIGAMIALLSVACSKEQPEQSVPAEVQGLSVSASVEQPGDGTKTSLDGLNVKWSVGDRIYLTDGTNCAIYEAESAALSTSFKYVSGAEELTGEVYAYYPAENVTGFNDGAFTATIPAVQPYVAGGFADGINPMTAKATVDEGSLSLNFKNVMSFVKLQIADSEADGKILSNLSLTSPSSDLCGTATIAVGDEGVPTTTLSGGKSVELSGISADLSSSPISLYIAVPVAGLGNLTITAKTEEDSIPWIQHKVAVSPLSTVRSGIYSYNPMQIGSFSDRGHDTESEANCYMINVAAKNKIVIPLSQAISGWNTIKRFETAADFDIEKITSGERSIDVRWLDGAEGSITLLNVNEEDMTLSFSGCTNGSNAVVDLKNDGEIVWSWHLWFTDYEPGFDSNHTRGGNVCTTSSPAFQEGGYYYGKVIMDRNLGATVIGFTETLSGAPSAGSGKSYWGLYYQFGRKDPFQTSGNVTTVDVQCTMSYAVHNPGTFIFPGNKSWSSTSMSNVDKDIWGGYGDKSALDPCPAGWRLPINSSDTSDNVWSGLTTDDFIGSSNERGFLWNGFWIPATGTYRGFDAWVNKAQVAFFWSALPRSSDAGYSASLSSSAVTICRTSAGYSSNSFPVRCIQE